MHFHYFDQLLNCIEYCNCADLKTTQGNPDGKATGRKEGELNVFNLIIAIHPKSWISWMEKSADDFEFSAERLSENATK